jgi:tetratricopeptide (TPR) repeat protein
VRLAAGWVHELSAREFVLRDAYLRARHLSTTGSRRTWFGVERERRLAAAERIYRDLLHTAPSDVPRVRLGRVLTLRAAGGRGGGRASRLSEAERLLSQVARSAGQDRDRYLAELFLAAARELRGDADGARAAYERALSRWPDAQAPRVGLLRRSMLDGPTAGGPAGAAAFPPLARAAGPGTIGWHDDPWFWYDYGSAWRLPEEFLRLRRRLRE